MRNDEMMRELSDVELDEATGGYYCVDSNMRRISCSYTDFDLGQDIARTMSAATTMGAPYY